MAASSAAAAALRLALCFAAICSAAAAPTTFSQLESAAHPGQCLDSDGGTSKLDIFACVDAHASNAVNELFALPAAGGTGAVVPDVAPGGCVTDAACDPTSPPPRQLCAQEQCPGGNGSLWRVASAGGASSGGGGKITLSLVSDPTLCLAVATVGGWKVAALLPCASSGPSAEWIVRATVTPRPPPPPPPPLAIRLDGAADGHEFDGHGLLSAGASSRYLIDYPEPQRSQILDFLFKPSFGAALSILKVEIGGDVQSTSGTEASHMHARDDLNCNRGYENWLMTEAKRRNPDIKTWGLSWGVPAWIGNGTYFSSDNIAYQTQWLKCVKNATGIDVDYIGIWNERPYGPMDYTIQLRQSLDEAGFASTKIVLPDGGISQTLVNSLDPTSEAYNKSFSDAVYALGQHGCGSLRATGSFPAQKFWCTESEVSNGWGAAAGWGGAPLKYFISVNQTSTTSWSLIWSVPQVLSPYQGRGAMLASEPWSGYYHVDGTIWMLAHWCQFASIGWKILGVPTGGSGPLGATGGQYVTLVSPDRQDFSVVVDFLHGQPLAQPLRLTLQGLPTTKPVAVWQTNVTDQFVKTATLSAASGWLVLTVTQGSIYTLTTLTTPAKGNFTGVPPSAPFPLPYSDAFDFGPGSRYTANDTLPRFFADQGGSFAVVVPPGGDGRDGVLAQMSPKRPGPNAWINDPDPVTLVGDLTWANVSVSVRARMPFADDSAGSGGGAGKAASGLSGAPPALGLAKCDAKLAAQRWRFNAPYPEYVQNEAGQMCLNVYGCNANEPLITYACLPGINAGCQSSPDRSNLRWKLLATGALVLNATGQCATSTPSGVFEADCASPLTPAQRWSWNASAALLVNEERGLCLTVPPLEAYVEVCGRIEAFAAFAGPDKANSGVCLRLGSQGAWRLSEGQAVLANGTVAAPGGQWHTLRLDLGGANAVASVDGAAVAHEAVNTTVGMASVGSGWHAAYFDNFTAAAL